MSISTTILHKETQRDSTYFLDSIVFKVEDTFFKVPRHHFARSTGIFGTTFSLPTQDGVPVDGSSEKHPFTLNIEKADFQAFLKVLHPLEIPFSYLSIQFDEWISVLKLATMWDFINVRNLAVAQMKSIGINPIDKVILGHKFRVRDWLKDGCIALVNRHRGVSIEEARILGLETSIRIYQIRESVMIQGRSGSPPLDVAMEVEKWFSRELAVDDSDSEVE